LNREQSRYIVNVSRNKAFREAEMTDDDRSGDIWAKVTDSTRDERGWQMGHGRSQSWGQGWIGPGWSGHGSGGYSRPGPPPWLHELVRSFGGPNLGGQRGPKVRRGDVRTAILDVLAQEPMNGYQIIQQISERSGGAWKPSPGSVYPTVQQLEDEGLVEGQETDGRRVLVLTDAGRAYVDEHPDELAATWRPFEPTGPEAAAAAGTGDLKPVIGQVMGAVWQIMVSGTDQQRAEAAEVLGETRRRLYGLLAEGEPE
jgi:DNA-binding PadR family transcriptional regulator